MSKSDDGEQGTILLLDDPAAIEKKFKRAVTDSETEVRFDPASKPGVSNLLSILGAATGQTPAAAAESIERYGDLKAATADAVITLLRPVQDHYRELVADPAETSRLLALGADKARSVASATLDRVRTNLGLLAR